MVPIQSCSKAVEMEKRNRDVRGRRGKLEADLTEARRRSDRLIDQVADGIPESPSIIAAW